MPTNNQNFPRNNHDRSPYEKAGEEKRAKGTRAGAPSLPLINSKLPWHELLLAAFWTMATAAFCATVFLQAGGYVRYPLDAYYYFDMAKNLLRHGWPSVGFLQGMPNKFFPGYPLALAPFCIFAPPETAWPYAQALTGLVCSGGLVIVARLWGCSRSSALAAGALLIANPIFVKWVSVPAAEGMAVALLLFAAILWEIGRRRAGWRWHTAAGVCAGLAVLTRPDAAYFALMLPAAAWVAWKSRPSVPELSAYLLPLIAMVGAFLALRFMVEGNWLAYGKELSTHSAALDPWETFKQHGVRLFRQPHQLHTSTNINRVLVALLLWFLLTIIISLTGGLGRKIAGLAWLVLGYIAAHSFWHYSSERFNVLVLPAVSLFVARSWEQLFTLSRHRVLRTARSAVPYVALIAAVLYCFVQYSPVIIMDHKQAFERGAGRPHLHAQIANERPTIAWSEIGIEFAYFFKGRTHIDYDDPLFYRQTVKEPGQFFRENAVDWVYTRLTPELWFAAHPSVSSSTLALKERSWDAEFTLYRVVR